jgi:hypothetical protein
VSAPCTALPTPWQGCTVSTMPPPRIQVADLKADPVERALWMRSGTDHAIPTRFVVEAVLSDPVCRVRLDVLVDPVTAQPAVREVVVQRVEDQWPFGPAVSATTLHRVAVETLLRCGLEDVAEEIVPLPDTHGFTGAFQLKSDIAVGRTDVAYGGRRVGTVSGRGRKTTEERLRQVADVYRAAVAAGSPPTAAVHSKLHVSRSHAGRLVGQARKAGILGETTPGKRGEQA